MFHMRKSCEKQNRVTAVIYSALLSVCMLLSLLGPKQYVYAGSEFYLSKTDDDYLDKLREIEIMVGVCDESAWCMDGEVECGTAVPYFDILTYEFGLNIAVKTGSWEENRALLKEGKLDLLFGVPAAEADGQLWLSDMAVYCSNPFYEEKFSLVTRSDMSGKCLSSGDSVFGMQQYSLMTEHIVPYLRQVGEIRFFDDMGEMFDRTESGELTGVILSQGMLGELYGRTNLTIASDFSFFDNKVAIGTTKQNLTHLLELMDRYAEDEENAAQLAERVQAERNHYYTYRMHTVDQEAIDRLVNAGGTIGYALNDAADAQFIKKDEENYSGPLMDFFDYVTESTGLEFEFHSEYSGEFARNAMAEGEIQLLFGLVNNKSTREQFDFIDWNEKTDIVPVILKKNEEQFDEGKIESMYWGASEEITTMLYGSRFEDRTVPFGDTVKMIEALNAGQLGGVLIKRSVAEALNQRTQEPQYSIVTDYTNAVAQVLAVKSGSGREYEFLSHMLQFYRLMNPDLGKNEVVFESDIEMKSNLWVWRIVSALAFVVIGVLVYSNRRLAAKVRLTNQKLAGQEKKVAMKRGEEYIREISRENVNAEMSGERLMSALPAAKGENKHKSGKPMKKDALTGLMTEAEAMKYVDELLQKNDGKLSVYALLDLDDFQGLNDSYGYDVGDEVMVSFAECLSTMELAENTVIFRKKGDVFGAFRANLSTELEYRIFLGELQSITTQVRAAGDLICATYRCGVAVGGKNNDGADKMSHHAEEALRFCKNNHTMFAVWEDGYVKS